MPERTSTRFRFFAAIFVLAAVALASCSAHSTPVAQATGTGRAQSAKLSVNPRADQTPTAVAAEPLSGGPESPAGARAIDAASAAPPDRPANDEPAAEGLAKPASVGAPKRAEAAALEVAELPPSALLAVGAVSFDFAPDDAGRLIGEFFALPRPIAASSLESPAEERPWPRSAERPPRDLIPAAEFSGPRVIRLERLDVVPLRPVVDLAPLGYEYDITRPERPSLPLAPKTALAGSDPRQLADLPQLGRMDEGVVTLLEDATGGPLLKSLLSPLGPLRTVGIPFIPPARLDPFEHAHEFELKSRPPDNDPPARPTAPLPAPVLP